MKLLERLKVLYSSKYGELCDALQAMVCNGQYDVKPAYPFLLSLTRWENGQLTESWYTDIGLKVMAFGQKTNSWTGKDDDFGMPFSHILFGCILGNRDGPL